MRLFLILALALPLLSQEVSQSGLRLKAERPMVAQPERAPKAMAATVHPLATDAAISILKKGGNAVDAAVAVAFVLGVVHPEAGNLGGSGYLMARMAGGQTLVFDYGGDAPAAANPKMFSSRAEQQVGYRSVAVPGTPAGMGLAHSKFGRLKWAEVLEPARRIAREGFPASQRMELILKLQVPVMKDFPETAKIFLHGSDQPLKQGELVVQRDLADTIRRLQKNGWKEFYQGETARRIAADMKERGGYITLEDLARYEARASEPLKISYRGFPVLLTPPSSTGGTTVALQLRVLDRFPMKLGMEGSAEVRHLQIEAMRLGSRVRRAMIAGAAPAQILSDSAVEEAVRTISLTQAGRLEAPPEPSNESAHTTHFTIADAEGNVVTNTYTLSGFYGSQVIAKGTGVLLNNHMSAFSASSLKPRVRYSSTMTPAILLRKDGSLWAAFGTPGAATIPSTLVQIVMNLVDFRMSLRDAVEFPRLHFGGERTGVAAEPAALVFDVAEKLRAMGHVLNPALRSQGDVNAVLVEEDTGWKQGWADGRRGGAVRGY
ncbi:MAG: gamma-glutamyltransferase [Bryobacteraceae bacterium]|nr:gamma-glutamyltransferase [Bryobacteraceae bacterium]